MLATSTSVSLPPAGECRQTERFYGHPVAGYFEVNVLCSGFNMQVYTHDTAGRRGLCRASNPSNACYIPSMLTIALEHVMLSIDTF